MQIEQKRFRTQFDARRFETRSVTIALNGKDVTYPCATLRHHRTYNGKMSTEKVLIFFADEVADLFNQWMPGFLTKSRVSCRWYMTLFLSDGVTDERGKDDKIRSFLRNAAEKTYTTDTEFPIKQLAFKLQVRDQRQFGWQAPAKPVLCDVLECSGAFESESLKPSNNKEVSKLSRDKTVDDVWKTMTREQQEVTYFLISKALESKTVTIKRIIFNGPATIVMWTDGTKTVVKCNEGDKFDLEKGIFAACAKKLLGTNKTGSNYLDKIYKAVEKAEEDKS